MARNIRIDRSEAEFLTDLLLANDNPAAKDISEEIRNVFGMISEEKEKQSTVKKTITMDEFIKLRNKARREQSFD